MMKQQENPKEIKARAVRFLKKFERSERKSGRFVNAAALSALAAAAEQAEICTQAKAG